MRVISQDGRIDIPYDDWCFSINSGKYEDVEYASINYYNAIESYKIAEYTSNEKALKAMGMLRNEYEKHYFGQGGAMVTANFYVPPFGFIPPKIFQFPKDDEVEV